MKQLTIRECAIDALDEMQDPVKAGALLMAICREAFGYEEPDFSDEETILYDYGYHTIPALYRAIAPDIRASVRAERE